MLWTFTGETARFALGRSHREAARRNDDHFGTVPVALLERVPWLERPLGFRSEHIRSNMRVHVGEPLRDPIELLLKVRLVDPPNEPGNDSDQQDVHERLHAPRAGPRLR